MGFFDIFAWVVVLLIVASVVAAVVFLGLWPGRVARARQHPQAEAIAIGSWLTLFLGFVLWPVVAIWAHMKPVPVRVQEQLAALEKRVGRLEGSAGETGREAGS